MKNTFIFSFCLLLNITCSAQNTPEIDQKFNWAIRTMDRWLIDHQPVCDVCLTPEKLAELNINLDSAGVAYFNGENMVSMTAIFDALTILSTITEIETSIRYHLGTFGITCTDCSTYESDRKLWTDWYKKNGAALEDWKLEQLKTLPRKV